MTDILALHEIASIETLTDEIHLQVSLSVSTVRRLCASARRAIDRQYTPAEVAIRKIVDAVFNEEHGLYRWKTDAPMDGDLIAGEISRAMLSRETYAKRLAGLLNGPDGARQRAEDAEAASRLAWRDRAKLEQDIAMLLRMLEAVDQTGVGSLARLTMAKSDFHFHREALTYRYRELKDADGKWKDGRGDYASSSENTCKAWKLDERPSWDAYYPMELGAERCALAEGHQGKHVTKSGKQTP